MMETLQIDRMLEDLGQDPYLRAEFQRGSDAVMAGYDLPGNQREVFALDIPGQRDYLASRVDSLRGGGLAQSGWTCPLIACEPDDSADRAF